MSSNNNSILSEKDANLEMSSSATNGSVGVEGGKVDTNSMEYHRMVLAGKMAAGKAESDNYVSPSDGIMSPCSAKLSAYKNKQFGKAKPQSLFAKTSSKNIAAQGGLFGTNKPTNPNPDTPMFSDKPAECK